MFKKTYSNWDQKYRPVDLDECVLTKDLRNTLNGIVNSGQNTNLLLHSTTPGTGKTTCAMAIARKLGQSDNYYFVNASLDRGINLIRNIEDYATTKPVFGGNRIVVLDEMDGLTNDAQKGIRGLIEKCSSNCMFIFTCNYLNNVIEPIRSRMTVVDFTVNANDKNGILKGIIKRLSLILREEKIEISEPKVLALLATRLFPDIRSCIVRLQEYANVHGKIDDGVLGKLSNNTSAELYNALKSKKFDKLKELAVYYSQNYQEMQSILYNQVMPKIKDPSSVCLFLEIIGDSNRFASNVISKEIEIIYLLSQLAVCEIDF